MSDSQGGRQQGGYGDNQQSSGYGRQSDHGRQEGSYSEGHQQGGRHGDSSGTSYGGGNYGGSDDFSGAEHVAQQHAGDSGDSSMFSSALGMLSGKKQQLQNEDLDEGQAVRQHQQYYGGGNGGNNGGGSPATSGGIGGAAAMQALKMFTGGSGGGQQSGGGGAQNQFIGMAMGQASKLFGMFYYRLFLALQYD